MQMTDCNVLLYRARCRGVLLSRCSLTADSDEKWACIIPEVSQCARVKNISESLRVGLLVYMCIFDVLACLAFIPFSRFFKATFGYPAPLCISHSL